MKIVVIVLGSLVLLVVLGYLILVLRSKALEMKARMKVFNAVSDVLDRLGGDSFDKDMEIGKLALNPLTRNTLYTQLETMDKLNIFPKDYLTQEAFSESDLVFWLAHPNELNAAPDEIELAARIDRKGDNDSEIYFLIFKYRTFEPHWAAKDGWMAGITGPYNSGQPPALNSPGTFSEMVPYNEKTPEEHVDHLIEKLPAVTAA